MAVDAWSVSHCTFCRHGFVVSVVFCGLVVPQSQCLDFSCIVQIVATFEAAGNFMWCVLVVGMLVCIRVCTVNIAFAMKNRSSVKFTGCMHLCYNTVRQVNRPMPPVLELRTEVSML